MVFRKSVYCRADLPPLCTAICKMSECIPGSAKAGETAADRQKLQPAAEQTSAGSRADSAAWHRQEAHKRTRAAPAVSLTISRYRAAAFPAVFSVSGIPFLSERPAEKASSQALHHKREENLPAAHCQAFARPEGAPSLPWRSTDHSFCQAAVRKAVSYTSRRHGIQSFPCRPFYHTEAAFPRLHRNRPRWAESIYAAACKIPYQATRYAARRLPEYVRFHSAETAYGYHYPAHFSLPAPWLIRSPHFLPAYMP